MGTESDNAVDISTAEDRNHSCMALRVFVLRSQFHDSSSRAFMTINSSIKAVCNAAVIGPFPLLAA